MPLTHEGRVTGALDQTGMIEMDRIGVAEM
jgi:hypothetical protein